MISHAMSTTPIDKQTKDAPTLKPATPFPKPIVQPEQSCQARTPCVERSQGATALDISYGMFPTPTRAAACTANTIENATIESVFIARQFVTRTRSNERAKPSRASANETPSNSDSSTLQPSATNPIALASIARHQTGNHERRVLFKARSEMVGEKKAEGRHWGEQRNKCKDGRPTPILIGNKKATAQKGVEGLIWIYDSRAKGRNQTYQHANTHPRKVSCPRQQTENVMVTGLRTHATHPLRANSLSSAQGRRQAGRE